MAKKTIEQPTDVEDADANYDNASDFDHFNNSPDIKLKSIEIDDEFSGQQQREADETFPDDNSGTGHKAKPKSGSSRPSQKSTLIQSNSYGSSTSEQFAQVKAQRDQAVNLTLQMK